MPKGVKSHLSSGFNFGFVGKHEQTSKSKLDGHTFVGTSTTESRALRRAYKGQGSSTKVLTTNPNDLRVARHKQTGLFNLSAFMRVNDQPPRSAPPPPKLQSPKDKDDGIFSDEDLFIVRDDKSDDDLLVSIKDLSDDAPSLKEQPINRLFDLRLESEDDDNLIVIEGDDLDERITAATDDAIAQLDDKLSVWRDGLAQPRTHDQQRRLIIQRDEIATSVETTLTELRRLERDICELEPSDWTRRQLDTIDRAKREAAIVAIKLGMPGLAQTGENAPAPDPVALEILAERLVALGDRLLAAGTDHDTYDLQKLIGLLSSHGRIRELSQFPISEAKTEAVAGMAELIDALLGAVGPGRDGSELNGFLGHSGELDGVLTTLRLDTVQNLLARDLARQRGVTIDDLSPEDWNEIENLAQEVVAQDAEMARARQQICRALEGSGGKDFNLTSLAGLRVDATLIKGLRERFKGDAKKVALIVAALKAMERASLGSEGTKRLRQALERELQEVRRERDREAEDRRTTLFTLHDNSQRMLKIDAEIEVLRGKLETEPDRRSQHNDRIAALEMEYEQRRLDRVERLWPALQRLTELDRRIVHLEERVRSLTPEAELLSSQIELAERSHEKMLVGLEELNQRALQITIERDGLPEDDGRIRQLNEDLAKVEAEIEQMNRRLEFSGRSIVELKARLEPVYIDLLKERRDVARSEVQRVQDMQPQLRLQAERIDRCLEARIKWLINPPPNELPTEEERQLLLDPELAALDDMTLRQARTAIDRMLPEALIRLQEAEDALAGEEERLGVAPISLTGGLTRKEIEELGLTEDELQEIPELTRRLARQGLSSTKQVSEICKSINGLMGRMGSSLRNDVDGALENQMRVLSAGDNDQLAGRFGLELVRSLTGNPRLTFDDEDFDEQMRNSLFGVDGDAGRLEQLTRMLDEHEIDSSLEEAKQVYAFYEDELVRLVNDNERKYVELVEAVRQFPGRNIDPGRPSGLAVSLALREAVRLAKKIDEGNAEPGDLEDFDNCRQQLRGFNPDTLEVPFWQFDKAPPDLDDIREWGKNDVLMGAAEGIIFLREEAPRFQTLIARCVSSMDIAVDRRMKLMGEAGVMLRDTVRAAILHTLVTTGSSVESFRPASHVTAIKRTLESWGVPVEDVLPEINRQLSESFGPDELNLWIETTKVSRELLEARREQKIDIDREGRDNGNETQRLKPHVAKALLDSVDKIQLGTRVQLVMGDRVEVQTGPISITGISVPGVNVGASVNVRLMGGQVSGLEIQHTRDGYELVIRRGWDGRVGGDFVAGPKVAGLRLEGTATLEAAGYRVEGVALRFPDSEAGCEALKDMLNSLITKGEMTPRDLSGVDNIMPLVEYRGSLRAEVGARVRFRATDDTVVGVPIGVNHINVPVAPSFQAGGSAGVTGTMKSFESSNTNLTVKKFTEETVTEASLNFNIYYALPQDLTPSLGSNQSQKPEIPLGGIDGRIGVSMVKRTKTKETRGPDGLVTPSTLRNHQMTMPRPWSEVDVEQRRQGIVRELGGPALELMLSKLSEEEREEIDQILAIAGPGDMINVAFSLDERVRSVVNELLLEAKGLRSGRIPSESQRVAIRRAKELEETAQQMIGDPDNYNPARLQLIPTRENLQNCTMLNLYYARWDRYVEDKSEWIAAEFRFDPDLSRQVRDELSGVV